MSVVDSSVPFELQLALNASEQQRQQDEAIALAQFNIPGGFEGNDSVATQAALRTAAIADYRRRIVIANTYGGNPAPFMEALRTLGTGGC